MEANILGSLTSCDHVGFQKRSFQINMMVNKSFVSSRENSFRDLLASF
mgnify:CR=1 FL=1